jgi:hypothetical protein
VTNIEYNYSLDAEPLYETYFFDSDKTALLDVSVLKLAEVEPKDIKHLAFEYCQCGRKHAMPGPHSSWCVTYKLEQEGAIEKIMDKVKTKMGCPLAIAKPKIVAG